MGDAGWFTLDWSDEGVVLLDQRVLPNEERYLTLASVEEVATAIEDLVVRGAPAIGCTAALGIALAAQRSEASALHVLEADLEAASERLARTRPTAVNLFWALGRMREHAREAAARPGADVAFVRTALLEHARAIVRDDVEICRGIGHMGLELVPQGARILTHCNAGALATAGYGTALGVVRAAAEAGRDVRVLADETRPFLQGARLTAWELARDDIPVSVHTDNMAGHLMRAGEIDIAVVGADRIAANGDVANKIGTYPLARDGARARRSPSTSRPRLSTVDFEHAGRATRSRSKSADATRSRRFGERPVLPDGRPGPSSRPST